MLKIASLTTLLLLPILIYAQQPYQSGLVLDDSEYEQLSFSSEHIKLSSGQRAINSKMDLSRYCPEVRHQGDISSCVGWSIGYGAMTIERAIKNNWRNQEVISQNANSALFVYNQIRSGDCSMGITMPKALNLIQEKGNCLASDFDFDVNDCSKEVNADLLDKAQNYRIEDYLPLFRSTADKAEKVKKVRLVLAQKKPVIVGMTVLANFYQIQAGDESWLPGIGDKTFAGGHAMVVVGYDDNKFHNPLRPIPAAMKGAFKLMNSWGKNWGEEGFIWVRYAHFAEYCKQAFALMLTDAAPISFDLNKVAANQVKTNNQSRKEKEGRSETTNRSLLRFGGYFGFQHYLGWEEGPVFSEAAVHFNKNHYQLLGQWNLGEKFQLSVKSGLDNSYIYVFSIDAVGKRQIHFPRSEAYNAEFAGENQSAFLWESGSIVTIPPGNTALELSQKGKDHLVVLFSKSKIKPAYIHLLSKELAKNRNNLIELLFNILGDYMVPLEDITYKKNEMAFEVSTRSLGRIVPIVLTVNVD